MKRCPNCQRDFPDEMRFCQTDGTPLSDVVAEAMPPEDPLKTQVVRHEELADLIPQADPFKTMVASAVEEKDDEDDVLQLPQNFDPMATMVVAPIGQDRGSIEDLVPEPPAFEAIKEEIQPEPPASFDLPAEPPISEPPAPVFSQPVVEPPVFSAPEPPPVEPPPVSVADEPPPTILQSQFDSFQMPADPPPAATPSGFEAPSQQASFSQAEPAAPFQAADPVAPQSPWGASPFDTPAPVAAQAEWNPPPAPVQEWGSQAVGTETPFQPPAVGTGGPSSTLAVLSLVSGIIGLFLFLPTILIVWCGVFSLLFGGAGVVMGFLARGRAKNFPEQFSGGGMAIGGILSGGLAVLCTLGWVVFWILLVLGIASFGALAG